MRRAFFFSGLLLLAATARAQDVPIYVDGLQSGFQNYSYDNGGAGSSSFANPMPFHAGAPSIAFTGDQFNAVSFAHATTDFATAQYPALRFFVHGGTAGNQQLRVFLQRDGVILANAELDTYVVNGPIAANAWRQVELRFGAPPLSFSGTFDRIDLQSDVNAQPTLYLDDVTLVAAGSPIFRDGFDDPAAPAAGELRFSGAAYSGLENAGPITVTVSRVNGSAGAASVHYATSDGSATAPADYASASGTLSWADGDAADKTFTVTPADDALVEGPETVQLALDTATGAALGAPSAATLTIEDDDVAGAFHGTNLVGMEFFYGQFAVADGPVPGTDYPVLDERLIDYFAAKRVGALRFLFSWEGMQSALMGPIPASNAGNYKAYFDNYKRIVDYATNTKGLTVIVTPWQSTAGGIGGATYRGVLVGDPAVPIAAWSDFWTKMATIFKDNPRVRFALVTEPHDMSTMAWWSIAQAGVTAIRASGATQRIYVPGNGYDAAGSWTDNYYDTAAVKRSNAYGYLNANGVGQPITDPANNFAVEVHTYVDVAQGGLDNGITAVDAARTQLAVAVGEARARGYRLYLGEIGMYAPNPIAPAAWADFVAYFNANLDVFEGWTWWAGGDPVFWNDLNAPHFAISPTDAVNYTGDTVNMNLIENDF